MMFEHGPNNELESPKGSRMTSVNQNLGLSNFVDDDYTSMAFLDQHLPASGAGDCLETPDKMCSGTDSTSTAFPLPYNQVPQVDPRVFNSELPANGDYDVSLFNPIRDEQGFPYGQMQQSFSIPDFNSHSFLLDPSHQSPQDLQGRSESTHSHRAWPIQAQGASDQVEGPHTGTRTRQTQNLGAVSHQPSRSQSARPPSAPPPAPPPTYTFGECGIRNNDSARSNAVRRTIQQRGPVTKLMDSLVPSMCRSHKDTLSETSGSVRKPLDLQIRCAFV